MDTGKQNRGNDGKSTDEPALTQRNSETVREEVDLSDESSTRPRSGAIPSSYGAPGGTVRGEVDDRPPDDSP